MACYWTSDPIHRSLLVFALSDDTTTAVNIVPTLLYLLDHSKNPLKARHDENCYFLSRESKFPKEIHSPSLITRLVQKLASMPHASSNSWNPPPGQGSPLHRTPVSSPVCWEWDWRLVARGWVARSWCIPPGTSKRDTLSIQKSRVLKISNNIKNAHNGEITGILVGFQ